MNTAEQYRKGRDHIELIEEDKYPPRAFMAASAHLSHSTHRSLL